ncbi:MFS general substrate transporter [Cadophora sp. DSE1049]|nr:MFS general substrate transporter [Cadophora sp. DSE1049]
MMLDSKGYAEGVDDTEVAVHSSSTPPHLSSATVTSNQHVLVHRPSVPLWQVAIAIALLFCNYFLAQYDKFILSYFQKEVTTSLSIGLSEYGILSGYATGIVYALLAIPVAYLADYTEKRVWILSIAAVWWSLCVIFQGLSHNFWQILLARIGMGIGQAPVEALSVSLISDLIGKEWVFFAESILYVGVYVGEAISAQIATAFIKTDTSWNTAMKAIGIVGIVIAVLVRLVIREPVRQTSLKQAEESFGIDSGSRDAHTAKFDFVATVRHVLRIRSFWLLTLSAGFRQLSGNVFGYYMPGYLSSIYPSQEDLLSHYGIIVGVVGSFSVVAGGLISSLLWRRTVMTPLYMTAFGGMLSSIFVVLMIFSKSVAGNSESRGTSVLYGVMSVAYLTAETWLGAFNSLLVLLLPPEYKTFGLAIYMSTLVLIYSTGPQIMSLALRNIEVNSEEYIRRVRIVLAVLIPVGYWLAGFGFLLCIKKVRQDIQGGLIPPGEMPRRRKFAFTAFAVFLGCLVVALFVTSLVFR